MAKDGEKWAKGGGRGEEETEEAAEEVDGDVGEVAVAGDGVKEEGVGEAGGLELPGVEGEVDDRQEGKAKQGGHGSNVGSG